MSTTSTPVIQTPARDGYVSRSSEASNTQAAWQASYLALRRHSSTPLLDKKLQTWQNGFEDADLQDLQRLVEERRLPSDAQSRVEGWLRECRAMEDRAKDCKASNALRNNIVQDCETELYRLQNQLLIKTNRFERIPHHLAKLRRWTGQEDERVATANLVANTTQNLREIQARKDDLLKEEIDTSRRPRLELLKEAPETREKMGQDTGSDSEYDDAKSGWLEPPRRLTWSDEENRTRQEKEQETRRLVLATRYKWPVNMGRAKTRYMRAMERQEWECDEVVLARHSWTF